MVSHRLVRLFLLGLDWLEFIEKSSPFNQNHWSPDNDLPQLFNLLEGKQSSFVGSAGRTKASCFSWSMRKQPKLLSDDRGDEKHSLLQRYGSPQQTCSLLYGAAEPEMCVDSEPGPFCAESSPCPPRLGSLRVLRLPPTMTWIWGLVNWSLCLWSCVIWWILVLDKACVTCFSLIDWLLFTQLIDSNVGEVIDVKMNNP